jgi:hypothetical protein
MIGEPDAGKLHVRFDEGTQETCDIATRLCPTLRAPFEKKFKAPRRRHPCPDTQSWAGRLPARLDCGMSYGMLVMRPRIV